MFQDQKAMNRVNRIVAAVAPSSLPNTLAPASCAGKASSVALAEGAAFARWADVKIAVLASGTALAEKSVVEKAFTDRGLQVMWCNGAKDVPNDTQVVLTMDAPVGKDVLEKASKMQLVAVAFSGFDHVDVDECSRRGVKVVNVPGYSSDATAELAIGLMLSHLRRLPTSFKKAHEGKKSTECIQEDLQSKTMGIVGTGKIGMRVAELAKAFKMKDIFGFDTQPNPAFEAAGGTYLDSLASVFLESDIVCVCVPLGQDTQGLVSNNMMSLLRPDSLLINVARGGVVDQAALAAHLKAGHFRAALDVFDTEPKSGWDALRAVSTDHLLMTPHIGYQAQASLAKRFAVTVNNIFAFLAGQPVNSVN